MHFSCMPTKCQFRPEISLSGSSAPANSAPPVWIVVLWKKAAAGLLGRFPSSSTTKSSPLAGHHPTPNHLCSLLDIVILLPRFTSCLCMTLHIYKNGMFGYVRLPLVLSLLVQGKTTGLLTLRKFLISKWVFKFPPNIWGGWDDYIIMTE